MTKRDCQFQVEYKFANESTDLRKNEEANKIITF